MLNINEYDTWRLMAARLLRQRLERPTARLLLGRRYGFKVGAKG